MPPLNELRSSSASPAAAGAAPLRVALVGYGYWGPNLLRNYMELPEAQVAWVCDCRPEALAKAQANYPAIAATTDLEVADPDILSLRGDTAPSGCASSRRRPGE